MHKKITGIKLLTAFLMIAWIMLTIWLLSVIGITTNWPAFTVLNLLTVIGINKTNIIKIFASSVSGILFAVAFVYGVGFTTKFIGAKPSVYLWLFFILMILLSLDTVFPLFINSYAFIVLTYSLVNVTAFTQSWPQTILSALLGGGFALAGIMGLTAMITKLYAKKTPVAEEIANVSVE